jgi:hypothetical protein
MYKILLSVWLLIILYSTTLKASDQNYYCLVEAIYFEGRSESYIGRKT